MIAIARKRLPGFRRMERIATFLCWERNIVTSPDAFAIGPWSYEPALHPLRKARDEPVAVRHLHLGKGLRVHLVLLADQLVLRQDVRRQSVDLVVAQRARLRERHRPADEVEERRRVGPEIGDGLGRAHVLHRRGADERGADAALALLAVAGSALLRVDRRALRGGAAALRQPAASGSTLMSQAARS